MGSVVSALCSCVDRPAYYSELDELKRDMAKLEREVGLTTWCCYKRGAYYKCSDTSWIS